jgi:hypothetical protein
MAFCLLSRARLQAVFNCCLTETTTNDFYIRMLPMWIGESGCIAWSCYGPLAVQCSPVALTCSTASREDFVKLRRPESFGWPR